MKSIDLFAGIGGMRLAASSLNFDNVFSSEISKPAIEIYKENFNEIPAGDITRIKVEEIPNHDLLMAGFPCQPFSSSGERKGFQDTRGTLFFEICRIVESKRPEAILLENVKGLIHNDRGKTLRVVLQSLENLGYSVSHGILNARDFGLPQNRERLFIVAIKGKRRFVDLTPPIPAFYPRLRDFVDTAESGAYLEPSEYTLIPPSRRIEQSSGLIFAGYRKKSLRKKGALPNSEHLSRVHRQPNRIYSVDGVSPTIASQESNGRYFILDAQGVRKLSTRELYRIMGFPEDYSLKGSDSALRVAIGNSVAVPVVREVVNRIKTEIGSFVEKQKIGEIANYG